MWAREYIKLASQIKEIEAAWDQVPERMSRPPTEKIPPTQPTVRVKKPVKVGAWAAEYMKLAGVVYHASPQQLSVLEPRTDHGDPGMPAGVFATPHKQMALAYAGQKWGDRDIDQSSSDWGSKWKLREMRPGAFQEIYGRGKGGYLHELPDTNFAKRPDSLGSDFEVFSEQGVTPSNVVHIEDPRQALLDAGVEMHTYDPTHPDHQAAIARMASRANRMSPEGFAEYVNWVRETNPEVADALLARGAKTATVRANPPPVRPPDYDPADELLQVRQHMEDLHGREFPVSHIDPDGAVRLCDLANATAKETGDYRPKVRAFAAASHLPGVEGGWDDGVFRLRGPVGAEASAHDPFGDLEHHLHATGSPLARRESTFGWNGKYQQPYAWQLADGLPVRRQRLLARVPLKTAAQLYDPPMSAADIEAKGMGHLLADPVHKWRAETGIELIHEEPTADELQRIYGNWQLMSDEQKQLSEAKAMELYGKTNEQLYNELLPHYKIAAFDSWVVSGLVQGALRDSPSAFNLKVEESFPDDPWIASLGSAAPLPDAQFRKLIASYSRDPDGQGKPFYFVAKRNGGVPMVVWQGHPEPMTIPEAKVYGRSKGVPEPQLDFKTKFASWAAEYMKLAMPFSARPVRDSSGQLLGHELPLLYHPHGAATPKPVLSRADITRGIVRDREYATTALPYSDPPPGHRYISHDEATALGASLPGVVLTSPRPPVVESTPQPFGHGSAAFIGGN